MAELRTTDTDFNVRLRGLRREHTTTVVYPATRRAVNVPPRVQLSRIIRTDHDGRDPDLRRWVIHNLDDVGFF